MGLFDLSEGGNMGFASIPNTLNFTDEELFRRLSDIQVSFGLPVMGDICGTPAVMYRNVTGYYDLFVRVHKNKVIMGKIAADDNSLRSAARTESEIIGGFKTEDSSVADRAVDEMASVIRKLENGETVTITEEAMPAATSTGLPIDFFIKENALELTPDFDIFDQSGEAVYHVDGNFTGHSFSVRKNGTEVLKLKRKVMALMAEYSIEKDGSEIARLKKKFKLVNPELNGTVLGEPVRITGDILGLSFDIVVGDRTLCQIDKAEAWRDHYRMRIRDESMQDIAVALAIICDHVSDREESWR